MRESKVSGEGQPATVVRLSARIAAAFVSNNPMAAAAVPVLIAEVHQAMARLGTPVAAPSKPAVPVARSVQHEYLVCLEDGKKLKMLKRYLRVRHGLSPDDYRRKWGLSAEYPMVAPAYSARGSQFAKSMGLGRRRAG